MHIAIDASRTTVANPTGTERYARLLFRLGPKEECRAFLERLIDESQSEAELVFAEDFLLRKFHKKRRSVLTDLLHDSPVLALDESFKESAEDGVKNHLQAQGKVVFHSENFIWNALFGILFWSELFESQEAGSAIASPFERRPRASRARISFGSTRRT